MKQYEEIYDAAIDNYGIITVEAAGRLGVHRKELLYWTKIGRLEHCGRGVYRLCHYVPTDYDCYAEALAFVGGDAVVYGESVLALLNLALVNPSRIAVATARRVRRTLPSWIQLVKKPSGMDEDNYNGIACKSLASAIRACRGGVMKDRLLDAVRQSKKEGYLSDQESLQLEKEIQT